MYCPNCGKQNDDKNQFCPACGLSLPISPSPLSQSWQKIQTPKPDSSPLEPTLQQSYNKLGIQPNDQPIFKIPALNTWLGIRLALILILMQILLFIISSIPTFFNAGLFETIRNILVASYLLFVLSATRVMDWKKLAPIGLMVAILYKSGSIYSLIPRMAPGVLILSGFILVFGRTVIFLVEVVLIRIINSNLKFQHRGFQVAACFGVFLALEVTSVIFNNFSVTQSFRFDIILSVFSLDSWLNKTNLVIPVIFSFLVAENITSNQN